MGLYASTGGRGEKDRALSKHQDRSNHSNRRFGAIEGFGAEGNKKGSVINLLAPFLTLPSTRPSWPPSWKRSIRPSSPWPPQSLLPKRLADRQLFQCSPAVTRLRTWERPRLCPGRCRFTRFRTRGPCGCLLTIVQSPGRRTSTPSTPSIQWRNSGGYIIISHYHRSFLRDATTASSRTASYQCGRTRRIKLAAAGSCNRARKT